MYNKIVCLTVSLVVCFCINACICMCIWINLTQVSFKNTNSAKITIIKIKNEEKHLTKIIKIQKKKKRFQKWQARKKTFIITLGGSFSLFFIGKIFCLFIPHIAKKFKMLSVSSYKVSSTDIKPTANMTWTVLKNNNVIKKKKK